MAGERGFYAAHQGTEHFRVYYRSSTESFVMNLWWLSSDFTSMSGLLIFEGEKLELITFSTVV